MAKGENWYEDAVFYELHVKAYSDSNADGLGDFRGLLSRLDYLARAGRRLSLAPADVPVPLPRRRVRHLRLLRHSP